MATTIVVPGLRGSGPAHWQTWLETRERGSRRVRGIDWQEPVIARWAAAVRREIDAVHEDVWLVAHSYGCLAAVVAAADRPEKVAGTILVAPADPARFSLTGLYDPASRSCAEPLSPWLPERPLAAPSVLVASTDDPWLELMTAVYLASRWGSRLMRLGPAGHINAESGYGPWPWLLDLLHAMQDAQQGMPLGTLDPDAVERRGRGGALARLRHGTRVDADQRTRPRFPGPS